KPLLFAHGTYLRPGGEFGGNLYVLFVEHQSPQFHGVADMSLASEPNVWSETQPLGKRSLFVVALGAAFETIQNKHAAGQASGRSAANVGMRDSRANRRLENGFFRAAFDLFIVGKITDIRHTRSNNRLRNKMGWKQIYYKSGKVDYLSPICAESDN